MECTVLRAGLVALSPAGPVPMCAKGDKVDIVSESHATELHNARIIRMAGRHNAKAKPADDGDELDGMGKKALVARAEQLGLAPGKMKVDELRDAIRAKLAETSDDGDDNGEDADDGEGDD